MKENMEKHLSLQDIADQIGYSPSHFSMLFKKKTGHGPVTYFNLLKIHFLSLKRSKDTFEVYPVNSPWRRFIRSIGMRNSRRKDKILIGGNGIFLFNFFALYLINSIHYYIFA